MKNYHPAKLQWEIIGRKIIGLVFAFIFLVFVLFLQGKLTTYYTKPDNTVTFQDGDIIFQSLSGDLPQHISGITQSPINHCGIVVVEKGNIFVIEASSDVCKTPIEEWVQRGKGKKFALMRMKGIETWQEKRVVQEAFKFLGHPYDFQYRWDDEKIYCSELVYKAYKRGIGVLLGNLKPLKEMNYKGHEEFIKKTTGGELPLNRKIITPVDIYKSPLLYPIYDDFKK